MWPQTVTSGVMAIKQPRQGVGVQNLLEKAAERLRSVTPVKFYISSRTDTGVHALGNSAHLDIQRLTGRPPFSPDILTLALNQHLEHPDIRVIRAFRAPNDFHARFEATSRTYLYRVATGCSLDMLSVFERNRCWAVKADHLDVAAMQEAAQYLQGTHNFQAFRPASENNWQNPVKTLLRASVVPAPASPFTHPQEKRKVQFWDIEFESKSFLYKQVRRMTACLVAVGLGALTPSQVKEKLESQDPRSGPGLLVAPAQGLFLKSVHYDGLGSWSCGPGTCLAMMPTALNDTGSHLATRFWRHHQLLAGAYSVVFALGLLENVVAGSRLLLRLKRSSPTAVLLLSMTVATTAFTCALPLQIHYRLHGGDWRFGEQTCRLSASLHWAFMYLSTTSFFCLCLDSYVGLAHPFTRLRLCKVHWAAASALLWVLAWGAASPLALGGPLSWTSPDNRTSCFENFVEDVGSGSYSVYVLMVGFLVPCTIILGCYPLLAWRVASGRRSWRCRRTLRTLGFSTLMCAVCFLPYSLTHLLPHLTSLTPFLGHLRQVTLLLVSLGSCLSPIICLPWAPRAGCWCWARLCSCRPKIFTIYDGKMVGSSCPSLGHSQTLGSHGEAGLGASGDKCPGEAPGPVC
ncbi:tRNA pseudouridine synthase-like 1 isoform X2 [Petaurus breviceps papuanus]|uniref:tRNA pseudouridine synthase-like 1 isoform X2 n=1 Tax=Petaurus breviceps papuanus TaxID=3040969 RepID=UPI0036DE3622